MSEPEATPAGDPGPAATQVRLYVAGDGPNSIRAIANVRAAFAIHPAHGVVFEIIDVVADPQRGLRDAIFVTPMLVRLSPPPERRIVGTLGDLRMLLGALGLPIGPE